MMAGPAREETEEWSKHQDSATSVVRIGQGCPTYQTWGFPCQNKRGSLGLSARKAFAFVLPARRPQAMPEQLHLQGIHSHRPFAARYSPASIPEGECGALMLGRLSGHPHLALRNVHPVSPGCCLSLPQSRTSQQPESDKTKRKPGNMLYVRTVKRLSPVLMMPRN
jgi:hypothetical protein